MRCVDPHLAYPFVFKKNKTVKKVLDKQKTL